LYCAATWYSQKAHLLALTGMEHRCPSCTTQRRQSNKVLHKFGSDSCAASRCPFTPCRRPDSPLHPAQPGLNRASQ
jgi:hypothetical protein